MTYEGKKLLEEPIKRKKIGNIIRKAGTWYDNHTRSDPYDLIEGYVLEETHNMLKQSEENLRQENIELRNKINTKQEAPQTEDEENQDYLNLMIDIKRIDKLVRRLDKRSRKSKNDDVTVRCANAIGLLEGKKLLLIQAVTHVTKKIKHDKRYNLP